MTLAFKLTIKLVTPFIMGRTRTTLDGLLSAAVFKETGLMGKDTIAHIPLARGEGGIFKASCMFVQGIFTHEKIGFIMGLRGRDDVSADLFSPNNKAGTRYLHVDTARGPHKANMSSYEGINARTVVFYAVGDPERTVQMIENNFIGLGKRSSHGAGQIASVYWEPVAEDWSWITPSGKPARPLPLPIWKTISASRNVPISNVTVQVPYWDVDKAVEAVHPVDLNI
ncbi:MAG: hypothetical protein ITG07_02145 [Candidimonas sp.]|nr:hypothetical protein [Candidimonas sp.]